ncbi:MAG: hypothetical protein KUL75_06560 [Sterolibacterium sp.]|nr:hypothetical protein [Sterolibacterium sp.]
MKKTLIAASIVTSILAAGSMAAQAAEQASLATLTNVSGKVLVNKGSGYLAAKSGTSLATGDRVISLNGATASVVYQDGCVTQMPENSLLAFDKFTACGKEPFKVASAKQPVQFAEAIGGTMNDGSPIGSGATTDRTALLSQDFPTSAPVADGSAYTMGLGGFLAGVVSLGVHANKNQNDAPVSPF